MKAILNDDLALSLRNLYVNTRIPIKQLAVMYNLPVSSVSRIISGEAYSDSPGPTKSDANSLSWEDVCQIRKDFSSGIPEQDIAKEYRLSPMVVRGIVRYAFRADS